MLCEIETTFTDCILRVAEGGDGRRIEGMMLPWGRHAPVLRPIAGLETYKRGALDKTLAESKRPIPLLLRHSQNEPAAVLESHDNREDGHWGIFRALHTRAGDDALELIRERVYLGLSIGATSVPARTTITRGVGGRQLIERAEVKLDHVGLVRIGAFEEAQVTALRSAEFVEFDAVAAAKARKRVRQRIRALTP